MSPPQSIQDVDEFVSSSDLEKCVIPSLAHQRMLCSEWVPSEWESVDALQWMGAIRMRVNGCSAVNGCRQNESQWMLCSEWVPSEWESKDALQWMGAVRMRVKGCSAVNGCRQNESQWMLCSEWVPSEWESKDALQWMGAVRMRADKMQKKRC